MTICCVCGQTGGKFRWMGEDNWAHIPSCIREGVVLNPGRDLWNFTTNNIHDQAGQPIKVQSLRHLRSLEREYGVKSVVANYNENNWER